MGVDTVELRREADHAERYERSVLVHPLLLRQCANEIDSLRAQLAEARKQAIPWRDGPARGGAMPPNGDLIAEIRKIGGGSNIYVGRKSQGYFFYGEGVLQGIGSGFFFSSKDVIRWLPVDDSLIPTEPNQ